MPSCVVKWCINQSHLHKKDMGISFHTFPQNEDQRQLWTKAVRLERHDKEWTPSKRSCICSVHFKIDDFYKTKKGFSKLKANVIPSCTMVISVANELMSSTTLSLMPSEKSSSNSNKGNIDEKPTTEVVSETQKCHVVACPSCGCKFDIPVIDSATEDRRIKHSSPSPDSRCHSPLNIPSSDSDIQSALNTPKTHRLMKAIKNKSLLSEMRLSKIRNLERRNKRLLKKCKLLKNITVTLKRKLVYRERYF